MDAFLKETQPQSRHQRWPVFALLALAVPTIGLSTLTLYVGLVYGLSGKLRDTLYTRQASFSERKALAQWRENLLTVWDAWLPYDDLAQIALGNAVELGLDKKEGRKFLPQVLKLETEALRRNPANTFAWARFAYARYAYNGPSTMVTAPLLQSIQMAPYEPDLLPSRITLALLTKEYWPDELKQLFPQQLKRAWLLQKIETVQAAYKGGVSRELRQAVSDDPVMLAEFDQIKGDLAPLAPQHQSLPQDK
jgi:hypothetical protein